MRCEGAGHCWVQNKWPRVTDLTDKLLGRLTERVGPSGPLNETQPGEGTEGLWGTNGTRLQLKAIFTPPTLPLIYPCPSISWGPGDGAAAAAVK